MSEAIQKLKYRGGETGLGMGNRDIWNIAKEESTELTNQLDIENGAERQES